MTPNEATKICEKDLKCAGFTFRGSLDVLDLPTSIYFVHHFPKEVLDTQANDAGNWMSYRTNRPFVVLEGKIKILFPPGIEPGTICVLGRCDNHYTTET